MTPEETRKGWTCGTVKSARGRQKKILTPEEKEAKRQKLNAYQRERSARKRQQKELAHSEA